MSSDCIIYSLLSLVQLYHEIEEELRRFERRNPDYSDRYLSDECGNLLWTEPNNDKSI